jgi:hypothetical protein
VAGDVGDGQQLVVATAAVMRGHRSLPRRARNARDGEGIVREAGVGRGGGVWRGVAMERCG